MNLDNNKRAHALASQLWGREAHEQLRALAHARGYQRWSAVPDTVAIQIIRDLQHASTAGERLAGEAVAGRCTRQQREKISAIRHSMKWSWSYIRTQLHTYNVTDWRDLSQSQADHFIQHLGQIAKGLRARAAKAQK